MRNAVVASPIFPIRPKDYAVTDYLLHIAAAFLPSLRMVSRVPAASALATCCTSGFALHGCTPTKGGAVCYAPAALHILQA